MANKSINNRQKPPGRSLHQVPPKPRNPYALAARQRKAGAHEDDHRTERRVMRARLRALRLNEDEE